MENKTNGNPSKHPWEVDVAVLLLFFNRPQLFSQVFGQVRRARPSRLFLYQDGPRDQRDMAGIEACRKIASQIDWECEVHRRYLDHNEGCDPSGFRSHKWAFSLADKVIVLEDDVVPALSFFPFCKEMLDRYEHDRRVMMIAGYNVDGTTTDTGGADYFFTTVFSVWGWASWRRVADLWEGDYAFMDDDFALRQLRAVIRQHHYRPDLIRTFKEHSQSGKEYFETISQAAMLLNSGLAVMPARNQTHNVGVQPDSTHFAAALETMPRRLRRAYTMESQELDFPLRHPRRVEENLEYKERVYRVFAWGHPLRKACYSLEELWLNLRHRHFHAIGKALLRRIRHWAGIPS